MGIGESRKPAKRHANGQIEPLDMASAYPVLFRLAEDRQLFDVDYRGRAVRCHQCAA